VTKREEQMDGHMQNYYVYIAYIKGVPKYVGKGRGQRYLHCSSGKSSCYKLNRDYFSGEKITVEFAHLNLDEQSALQAEAETIGKLGLENLYNSNQPTGNLNIATGRNLSELRDVRANYLVALYREGDIDIFELDAVMPYLISTPHHLRQCATHWDYCCSWINYFSVTMLDQWTSQGLEWSYPSSDIFKASSKSDINSAARQCMARWESLNLGENMKWYAHFESLLTKRINA